MSASFHLQLDTHAPVITWGAIGGTTGGELLQVGYTIDEPALISATIRLADGRTLPLTDTGLTLEALLPADTPDGNATISALVRDDVLNEATRTRVVHLTGTVIIPEEPPSPGWPTRRTPPRRPRRPQPTVVRSRTSARARTRSMQTAKSRRYVATGVATSSQRMSAAGAPSSSTALAAAASRHVGELVATASSRTVSRGTVRRRDGGDLEALVALGLL